MYWQERRKTELCYDLTENVIIDTRQFIISNHGQWPRAWGDLISKREGIPSRYVIVRFDLSSKELLDSPDMIFTAIRPVLGDPKRFKADLEDLREQIRQYYGRR